MALDSNAIVGSMKAAGQNLGDTLWKDMQTYAVPELQKIATQIIAIEEAMHQNPPPYTQAAAQILLNMQITATVGVIVGMTTLTMVAVQSAINSMLAAVKGAVNTAAKFTLIP
jgi:hypothetical protein